jgi:hypothetical protein
MPELAPVTKAVMFSKDLDIFNNSFGHRPGSTHPVQQRGLPLSGSFVYGFARTPYSISLKLEKRKLAFH